MFYVQPWQSLYPQNSAFEILKIQLASAESSLNSYDASKTVARDTYLSLENQKIQELAQELEKRLETLTTQPKNKEIRDFLFKNDPVPLKTVRAGLNISEHLQRTVDKKINHINESFQEGSAKVNDPYYAAVLKLAQDPALSVQKSHEVATAIIQCLGEQVGASLTALENESPTQMNVEDLIAEIRKDLGQKAHKLYHCTVSADALGEDSQHSFVVEQTTDDQFRIYQSYDKQYSLKSFLASEMQAQEGGLRRYEEFYPLLETLSQLKTSTSWDQKTNELFRQFFAINHDYLIQEPLIPNQVHFKFTSIELSREVIEQPVPAEPEVVLVEETPATEPLVEMQAALQERLVELKALCSDRFEKIETLLKDPVVDHIQLGAEIGAMVSTATFVSLFGVNLLLKLTQLV